MSALSPPSVVFSQRNSPLLRSLSNDWPAVARCHSAASASLANSMLQLPADGPLPFEEIQIHHPSFSFSVRPRVVLPPQTYAAQPSFPPAVQRPDIARQASAPVPQDLEVSASGAGAQAPDQAARGLASEAPLEAAAPQAREVKKRKAQSLSHERLSLKRDRNRLSATRSRARKKLHVERLEQENQSLTKKVQELTQALVERQARVVTLSNQVVLLTEQLEQAQRQSS